MKEDKKQLYISIENMRVCLDVILRDVVSKEKRFEKLESVNLLLVRLVESLLVVCYDK